MEVNVILTKGRYTLLENYKEYIVAYNYNENTKSWEHGHYFTHWGVDEEIKIKCLANAIDCIRYCTDELFITKARMTELATIAIHAIVEETDFETFIEDAEMAVEEAVHFGVFEEYNNTMY